MRHADQKGPPDNVAYAYIDATLMTDADSRLVRNRLVRKKRKMISTFAIKHTNKHDPIG